jgi:nitrate reductase beta subunit
VAVETFNALKQRQTSDTAMTTTASGELRGRVNLLNWDGNGAPDGLFPGSSAAPTETTEGQRCSGCDG